MDTSNMGRPVRNKHGVSVTQWRRWSNRARSTFNNMYHSMRPSMQFAFLHPDTKPLSNKHWATVRWNTAWTAAQIADGRGPLKQVKDAEA
jgi:hypothetical protein